MPNELSARMAQLLSDTGHAPWEVFTGHKKRIRLDDGKTVWILPFSGAHVRPGVDDDGSDWEIRRIQGMHGTTVAGAIGIIKDGFLRGSEDLPGTYFKGGVDGPKGDVETGMPLFRGVAAGTKNQSGLMFELTARRKMYSYAKHLKTRADEELGGTYWDVHVTMELGGVAHYRTSGENRYCVDGRNCTLIQLWVEEDALVGWQRCF